MSLKATFIAIGSALSALTVASLVIMGVQVQNLREVDAAEKQRHESFLLANRLHRSSDDLTRMARTYAVTGDARFETYFHRILAIRNGEAPRPADYGPDYWDIVTATHEEPDDFIPALSLETLMRRANFSEQELAKLEQARRESDDLVRLENRAMAAVKGLYPDERGEFTRRGEPDLALARDLLHGTDYHQAKSRIMQPIDEFLDMVDARTGAEVAAARASASRFMLVSFTLAALTLSGIAASAVVIRRRVSEPVNALAKAARAIEDGEHPQIEVRREDELGLLTRAFNQMSAAIERDIARRARTESELKRVNFLSDIALELTGCGYWHIDYGDPDHYYQSPRAAQILGEEPKPDGKYHLQREWFDRLLDADPEGAQLTSERYQGAIEGRYDHYESTYAYKRPADGRIVWVHALGRVVRSEDRTIRFMYGVYQDVTKQVESEAALRSAMERVEAATKAKSSFLANMSHEIRTPMNGIIGMTELALDTNMTAEQRDYLTTVKSSADALLSIINDILDFSKIEAGRLELDPVEFLLRDSISDTLSPLALRAASKGVELAYDVRADVPDALIGDVYRLRQVIVNLVGNAIKFTERGEVVISVSVAERRADGLAIEIVVSDTGIGISPEAAARLFKAFEQAETSTTRKYGGTGLGLAISKQIVELMGGEIELESTLGVGSKFKFRALFKEGVARPSATVEDAAKVFAGKVTLVVDDNETNRRILGAMLGQWGMRTILAESASEALAALDRARNAGQNVSLIITDLHMPDTDGFDLTRAIRAHPSFSALPVMLLTSSASSGDQARCVELGVAARLLKPVKQSLLLDNMMRVLGSSDRSRAAAASPEPCADAAERPSRSLRVLLAEDNPVNQKFAIRVLEGAGHRVSVANNGREAVEHSGSGEFEIVLMDVQMPEMDGLDATRAIRARESGGARRLPIIAMTANAMAGDREMCIDAGMDGYVPKPVKRDLLFAEIERVLKEAERGTDI